MNIKSMRERFDEKFIKHRVLHGGDKYPRLESIETSNEILDFIEQELELKDQEHKAELGMIKGEINALNLPEEQLFDDFTDVNYNTGIQDSISILDSHINK